MGRVKVEICVDADVDGAVEAAYAGGADTVELCAAMHTEGLTPSPPRIEAARRAFGERPGLVVMVRPRPGDFFYTRDEVDSMAAQIRLAVAAGADGIACGATRADGRIDGETMRRLGDAAAEHGAWLSLHRAFDAAPDPFEALDEALETGCRRILSCGRPWGEKAAALDGATLLKRLALRAGRALEIIAAGGVGRDQCDKILEATGGRVGLHAYSSVQRGGRTHAEAVRELVQATKDWQQGSNAPD